MGLRRLMAAAPAALLLAACGGDEPQRPAGPPATVAPSSAPATVAADDAEAPERSCPDVEVPGHLAREVLVTGATCEQARPVVAAAAGRGRAAYAAEGLRCTPNAAAGGETDYACTGRGIDLAFLYGAR